MPKFRKKPVVIEAHQWVGTYTDYQMIAGALGNPDKFFFVELNDGADTEIEIETLEGTMRAQPNDWIIRGVKGELYPCKPDIFEATYEPAE